MESVTRFIVKRLRLKVNSEKSAVAKPQQRKFLGFSLTGGTEPSGALRRRRGNVFERECGRSRAGDAGWA